MDQYIKDNLWGQFGASIDMLENAINLCPEDVWGSDSNFWYISYHCLFWLDYYLSTEPDNFSPPPPFTLSEFNPDGELPERIYTKEELLNYLKHGRNKCFNLIRNLTDDLATSRWINDYKNYSVFEILIYNLRHVQHHSAQLNLLLRQQIDDAPLWVSVTNKSLN